MGLILVLSTVSTAMGLIHIIQIIWTKANKDKLLSAHKPDSLVYGIHVTNLSTKRLVLTIIGTIIAAITFVVSLQSIVNTHGDSASSILVPCFAFSGFVILGAIFLALSTFRKNS